MTSASSAANGTGPTFALTTFKGKRDARPHAIATTWAEFCARTKKPIVRADKDGELFAGAWFDPAHRCKENVKDVSVLALDYDDGAALNATIDKWKRHGVRFAWYTTYNHQRVKNPGEKSEKPPCERYRVVIPLDQPIPVVYYPALWRWAERQADGVVADKITKDCSRMSYWPAKASADAEYKYGDHNGALLNWREIPEIKYVVKAFESECAKLKATKENGESRHDQLFRSAAALGELVGGGGLCDVHTEKVLVEIGAEIGKPDDEVRRTVRDGLAKGARKPRTPDASQARANGKKTKDKSADQSSAAPGGDEQTGDVSKNAKADPATQGTQADMLVDLAADIDLFYFDDIGYATFQINGHRETHRIKSKAFRVYLRREFYLTYGKVPNGEAMTNALAHLDGVALFDGKARPVFLRLAWHDGKIYWDLANDAWQIIEITAEGWKVIEAADAPVRFWRSRGMQPLPQPAKGGDLATLKTFINYPDDAAWALHAAWLIASLRVNARAFPILILNGEQGSGKTTAAKMTRRLIDPNKADVRRRPRQDKDIFIAANNGWVCAFDNLSGLPREFSDTLCSLATGAGHGDRELYENDEECLLAATRPIILSGIDDLAEKADIVDRGVFIEHPPIPDEDDACKDDETLWADFETEWPKLIGVLADAVQCALKKLPDVKLKRLPRMADFMKWGVAASVGGDGVFYNAYLGNRVAANDLAIRANDVAAYVAEWYEGGGPTTITLTDLLGELARLVRSKLAQLQHCKPEKVKLPEGWPTTERKLGNELRRCAPNLRKIGIEVIDPGLDDRTRKARRTFQRIKPKEEENKPSQASQASQPPQGVENTQDDTAKEVRREGAGFDGKTFANENCEGLGGTAEPKPSQFPSQPNIHNDSDLTGVAKVAKVAKVANPDFSGGVPSVITSDMRRKLYERGIKGPDINRMTPEQAWQIINGDTPQQSTGGVQ